jgi:two-component system response regulator YesN
MPVFIISFKCIVSQGFNVHLLFIIQIVITFFSGITFLFAAFYFLFLKKGNSARERYFVFFLSSFSIYLLGRPLQILFETADMNSAAFLVNAARLLLLFIISFPSLMLLSDSFSRVLRPHRSAFYFTLGCVMGFFYLAVNILARIDFSFSLPHGSSVLKISTMSPEVLSLCTSGVQAIAGFLIFISTGSETIRRIVSEKKRFSVSLYEIISSSGIAAFGLSFFIGAYLRIWTIPYSAALPCAIIIGYGLVRDMQKSIRRARQMEPLLESEVHKALFLGTPMPDRIPELLKALGKSPRINTIAVGKICGNPTQTAAVQKASENIHRILAEYIGEESFIMFPVQDNMIGIAFSSKAVSSEGTFEALLKKIQERILRESGGAISFGIGRNGSAPEDLTLSYYDALFALERSGSGNTPAIGNILEMKDPSLAAEEYPLREKELFLSDIRRGDVSSVRRSFPEYFRKLAAFAYGRPEIMNLRLYELLGSAIDAAIAGGGDITVLQSADLRYYRRIAEMREIGQAEKIFSETAEEIADLVFKSYRSVNNEVVARAKKYIIEHSSEPVSIDETAEAVGLSRSYFLRLFKDGEGITFTDYLTALRISKAKELLLKTDKSVTDIAFEVGFNDSNYFSKVFSDAERVSPSGFRKSAKAGS